MYNLKILLLSIIGRQFKMENKKKILYLMFSCFSIIFQRSPTYPETS